MSVEQIGNLIKIEFNNSVFPKFVEKRNKEYVWYGEKNDYPAFIIDLYNKHPEHCAIIKAKSKYITGKGFELDKDQYRTLIDAMRAQKFLEAANRYEDWSSILKKTADSLEIFNGWAWEIIWNLAGTAFEVYCLQFSRLRRSADKSKIYYSDNWLNEDGSPNSNPKPQEFETFNPNKRKGRQILYYTVSDQYTDGVGDVYPLPEYKGAIINIYTDIAISEFQNNLALHGMTAQGMLTLFKGEPTPDERRKLDRLFNNKFTGPSGSKVILNFTNDQGDRGAEWTTFQTSDLDKQFELICRQNQQKIITGHQIPNKSLVGISVEGALSDRTAIDLSFEQLQNAYTEPRQELIIEEIKMLAGLVGVNLYVNIKRLKPLGVDFLDARVKEYVTKEEVRNYLGLEAVPETAPTQVNENLRGLTGKDWIHIKRLIREVSNGKTQKEAAALMIKSAYGLSDDDINVLFGQGGEQVAQFNAVRLIDDVLKLYEACAIDDNDDPVVEYAFAETSILEREVLDLLKGEPTLTANKLAIMLEVDVTEIESALNKLATKGYVDSSFQPTQKGLDAKTITPDVETYTVYKYVTREGVPRANQTRPFCKRLLDLTASGKVWTKEAIDNLTNEIGEDAWTYRGGFYTNPYTQETTPYCRHIWKSVIKTRRK